jgi:glucosamine kinase
MIAIADCGGTKCEFKFSDNSENLFTKGINPNIHSTEEIIQTLNKEQNVLEKLRLCTHLYYFGAGCSTNLQKNTVQQIWHQLLPSLVVDVKHDLELAQIALCKNTKGFVCILGTGSNALFYDGISSFSTSPSLGFILGDEGSGAHIGKKFIRDYFYKEIPNTLYQKLALPNLENTIEQVYKKGKPNEYVASFTKKLFEHRNETYVAQLIQGCFQEFLNVFILKHKNSKDYPIHFTGSIAFHFQEHLLTVLHTNGLKVGTICKNPLEILGIENFNN